jgi:hypothetical protein
MAVLAAGASIAAVATATPASAAARGGPRPLVNVVRPVTAGVPTWVKTFWVTRRDVCDAKVTVAGKGVRVSYPSNTGTYTSFRRNATLAAGSYDYTAYNVTAAVAKTSIVKLKVTISYTQLPRGTFRPGVDPEGVPCDGKEKSRVSWVSLPVVAR